MMPNTPTRFRHQWKISEIGRGTFLLLLLGLSSSFALPAALSVVAYVFFHSQEKNQALRYHGQVVATTQVALNPPRAAYFQGRPSCIPAQDALLIGQGCNYGPTSADLYQHLLELNSGVVQDFKHKKGPPPPVKRPEPLPILLATRSASGLDPFLDADSLLWQLDRVALARHLSPLHLRQQLLEFFKESDRKAHWTLRLLRWLPEKWQPIRLYHVTELNLWMDAHGNSALTVPIAR